MLSVWPKISDASRPNGTAMGSVSRIVTGWMNDSNCAASTMYMNTNESANAMPK
jgi:hypothetical protein